MEDTPENNKSGRAVKRERKLKDRRIDQPRRIRRQPEKDFLTKHKNKIFESEDE